MAVAPDSPLVKRVEPSPPGETWSRQGAAIAAIGIHMAEGGGTSAWLSRLDGNSSHYVVEYDGDLIQKVPEALAAGSMNPRLTRTTNDDPYTYLGTTVRYGITALRSALGALYRDPNRVIIAIEVEGFALTGPNAAQRSTLKRLVNDIRRRRGRKPCIGHRDQQSYKRCPGHKIPWVDYGGHAVAAAYQPAPTPTPAPTPEEAVKSFLVPERTTLVTLKPEAAGSTKSRWLYDNSALQPSAGNRQLQPIRPLVLVGFLSAETYIVAYEPTTPDANDTSQAMYVRSTDVATTSPAPAVTQGDLDAEFNEALKAASAALDSLKRGG